MHISNIAAARLATVAAVRHYDVDRRLAAVSVNGKYGNRAASWSDGTAHARHRRHVDGVIDTDTVEDEGRKTERIPACAARRVVAEKKGERKTEGENEEVTVGLATECVYVYTATRHTAVYTR